MSSAFYTASETLFTHLKTKKGGKLSRQKAFPALFLKYFGKGIGIQNDILAQSRCFLQANDGGDLFYQTALLEKQLNVRALNLFHHDLEKLFLLE